ncbi:MAG: ATP-dependent RecD-like DNA helicase [Ignavibacteriales bacterium]|nr:ATP-dependent RecD-like DNA helicase [Ignavibacteriales bacterium]
MKNLQQTTLHGTLDKIIYYNNENGYLIGVFELDGEKKTAVGYLPSPHEGDEYSLTGAWTNHSKYGRQFTFESFEQHVPTSQFGVEQFLSSGLIKGIGPSLASKIVDHFGTATIEILNKDPERLLEIDGIGRKKLAGIMTALVSLKEMQDTLMFLKSHGITTSHSIRLYKTYGKSVVGVLQHNPYQIIDDVVGIGFHTADEIARKMGVKEESEYRLTAGVRFVLDDACRAGGHCYLPMEELSERGAQLLRVDEAKVTRAIHSAVKTGYLVQEHDSIFPMVMHRAEEQSEKKIGALLKKGERHLNKDKLMKALHHVEKRHDIQFDEKQRIAVISAILNPVTILTGGPGTGKTLCVNGIIELADELGVKYVLCAPTGRAAKRLSEVSEREAKTIHRVLEFDPNSCSFRRNSDDPIEAELVIVDEVSMVDIQLFEALTDAISANAQLVLVGDVDQLPSVGPGQVLRDLIESKTVTTVRLSVIFRQAEESSIIMNSHRINHGDVPQFADDFNFIDADTPEEIQSHIVGLCSTVLPQNYRYDPLIDIQVLSPMNNGVTGVRDLNKKLQQVLNGHSTVCWQGSERKFLLNDKVMQLRNNYDKEVYNGDIGKVTGYDKEEGKIFISFYGKRVEYTFEELDQVALAYATTIHKSQGNEFTAVIIPVSMAHYIMLQRNLIYTAVTRAKQRLYLIGQRKALAVAINNADTRLRNTLLLKRLKSLL